MKKPEIIKRNKGKLYFNCDMCNKPYQNFSYTYQSISYVAGYNPPKLEKVCKKCVYKEVYGSKNFNKKMKEGSLDD